LSERPKELQRKKFFSKTKQTKKEKKKKKKYLNYSLQGLSSAIRLGNDGVKGLHNTI
jgi:hypothetical protein